jgi:adenine-specific DNA-methyltransferase
MGGQLSLFDLDRTHINTTQLENKCFDKSNPFPTTRYQGSKAKIVNWIWDNINHLNFITALDAFGGTGSVSHMLKRKGKQVTYNDKLKFNYTIGKALIENSNTSLRNEDINFILSKHNDIKYPTFIQDTFKDIFYLPHENAWLDMVVTNIRQIGNEYKQALAWFALFQSCIIKRPYNLFHRANLYVRTSDVERNFGNKTTWDKSFEDHFTTFVFEANKAVLDNGKACRSISVDALEIEDSNYDLVYIDTPYISSKGVGTDYLDFYHFLEGMLDYDFWGERILTTYKHLPLNGRGESPWIKKDKIKIAFEDLIKKFNKSVLVISYRRDGIPSEDDMIKLLQKYKNRVYEVKSKNYKYVLSHGNQEEILFIAE